MSGQGDDWYKRYPRRFLDGIQGMGPELIGAYAVILDIIYARDGDMVRDDRHLAGVLGCSMRKARALTDALIESGKLQTSGGRLSNHRAFHELFTRKKHRETSAKGGRNEREKGVDTSKFNNLCSSNRREEKRREESNPQEQVSNHRALGPATETDEDGIVWDVIEGGKRHA